MPCTAPSPQMPSHPIPFNLAFRFVSGAVESRRSSKSQARPDSPTSWSPRTGLMCFLVGGEPISINVNVCRSQNYDISPWREYHRHWRYLILGAAVTLGEMSPPFRRINAVRRRSETLSSLKCPSLPKLATISSPRLEFETHFLREELDLFVPIIRGYHTEKDHPRPYVETAPSSPEIYPQTPPSCSWPDPPSPCFPYTCLFDFTPELDTGSGVVTICHIVPGDGLKTLTRTVPDHLVLKPVIEASPTPQPRIPKTIGSRKWRYEQRRAQRIMEEEGIITATARTLPISSPPVPIVGAFVTAASEMTNKPTAPHRHTQARVEYRERSHSGAKTAVLNPAFSESSFALPLAAARPLDTSDNARRKLKGRTWSKQQKHLAKLAAGD